MTRRTTLVLAGILLAQSVIVALVFTPLPHSGGDNAGYISLAHSLLDRGAYLEIWDPGDPPHTKYPPVFPILLAMAILLGAKSWAALKMVPAFFTVMAVAFTFLWARDRRGLTLGLVVALLLGLSESVVYYSQWILSDPTFLALTMAALWALQKSLGPAETPEVAVTPEVVKTPQAVETPEVAVTPEAAGMRGGKDVWLVVGMALVVVAYFTRSAGLPLAAATLFWLGIQKRWKALAGFAVAFGFPAFLWWLRGSGLGGSEYTSEFWLVDPYQPHLGTIGPLELLDRLTGNLVTYVTRIVPAGVAGDGMSIIPPLGIGLGLVALVGWFRMLREKVGAAELFFPLYFGLILLWPPAWSGDRFALPLLPLMFFYAGVALLWLLGAFPVKVRGAAVGVLVLALALPAGLQLHLMAKGAWACRELTRIGSSRECLSPAQGEYLALAEWSGENLPDGAVVTTRKPRTFFLMSGVKTQSIPLLTDPDDFLISLRERESRYVSLDLLDGMSGYYVYPVLLERLSAFCGLVQVGAPGQTGTQLLGVAEADAGAGAEGEASQALARCPGEMFRASPRERGPAGGWDIPLLVSWRDRGK